MIKTPWGPADVNAVFGPVKIKVKTLPNYDPSWPLPQYAKPGDSGVDVFAAQDVEIAAGDRQLVRTGLCVSVPEGYEIQVRPRSGIALKDGVSVLNTPGTIDSGYRGEIGVIVFNPTKFGFSAKRGQKIAQLVCCPVVKIQWEQVDELDETDRSGDGFGSTGK